MDQSTLIIGAILAGFVLYLAAANRLGVYVAILTGRTSGASSTSPTATSTSTGTSSGQAPGIIPGTTNPYGGIL